MKHTLLLAFLLFSIGASSSVLAQEVPSWAAPRTGSNAPAPPAQHHQPPPLPPPPPPVPLDGLALFAVAGAAYAVHRLRVTR